jgi:HD-like signal output (HDOD) protein
MSLITQEEFLQQLESEIASNKIVLPTLPEVALKVRDAAAQGNTTAHQLAEIVATDTALSARLLQIANSPLYRARHEIENIQVAITRLGNNTIRSLVTSLVMQQMYQPTSPALEQHFRKTWENSVNTAAICRALASMRKQLDPEQAMLAGLIHQIGKLPILAMAETIPELANNEAKLAEYLDALHPQVGKIIMDNWEFPEALKKVPSDYVDFYRCPPADVDYVDIVIVAHLQGLIDSGSLEAGIDLSTVPAFAKLGLSPEIEVLEIEGISEEVEQAQNMMRL